MYDPGEQTSEHQPYRGFLIDAWPTVVRATTVGDLFPRSGQVKYTIDPRQHVLIWDELFERASDEEF